MEQGNILTNEQLVTALRERQTKTFEHVYQESLLDILSLVFSNGGREYNARDLLQEAIIILFRKLQKPEFSLPCEITTYIYSICRKICYNNLQEDKLFWASWEVRKPGINLKDVAGYLEIPDLVEDQAQNQQDEQLKSAFICLHYQCPKILSLFYFYNQNLQDIAKAINYSSADAVKARKSQCIQKLKEVYKSNIEAEDNLELIDQFLRKELTEKELGCFEERLREDVVFLQEVELQKKIILKIQEREIVEILDKTHKEISERNKSEIQKHFEWKEAMKTANITWDPNAYERIKARRLFEEKFLSELPAKMGYVSIPYEGNLKPPFRIKVTSGKAQFEYLRINSSSTQYSFHYLLNAEYGNVVELILFGDFDPAKLTLVYHKQYDWWSLKLRIDAKEYDIDYSWRVQALIELE